jgi:gamma-glutamyl hydrolase
MRLGVLMMQPPGPKPYAYISTDLYKWLQKTGVTIVPIPPNISPAAAAAYFEHIHGLFLHPGWSDQPRYEALIRQFLRMAVEANRAGDYFPVWGTCQGLQRIMQYFGGDLEDLHSLNLQKGSKIILHSTDSRILNYATAAQANYFRNKFIPYFNHEKGISLYNFMMNKGLRDTFNVITTSHDRKGVEYISMIEGKDLPFYGVQYHPEKSVHLGWMVAFLVAEMQKSQHTGFCPGSVHLTNGECGGAESCMWIALNPRKN